MIPWLTREHDYTLLCIKYQDHLRVCMQFLDIYYPPNAQIVDIHAQYIYLCIHIHIGVELGENGEVPLAELLRGGEAPP